MAPFSAAVMLVGADVSAVPRLFGPLHLSEGVCTFICLTWGMRPVKKSQETDKPELLSSPERLTKSQ